jgi:beta-lactamase regulating signal transducer with metallopeptidase domain
MNIIQMSLSAALIIAVTVLIRAVAINRLPKKMFLILWATVLCRLLIPFNFPAKFSAFTFFENLGNQVKEDGF